MVKRSINKDILQSSSVGLKLGNWKLDLWPLSHSALCLDDGASVNRDS